MIDGAAEARAAGAGTGAVLTAVCLGLMLSMFNSTLVNVVLPDLADGLHAGPGQLQWVSALYTLFYASALLPGGALGNLLGRRAAFLLGVAVFAVGSLACAVAPGIGVLLAARAVQAIGAAVMLPQTLSILVHEYSDERARARAVGVWSGVSSLALAAGPVLGGAIVAVLTWRWAFVVSVALGLVAWTLAYRTIPRSRHGSIPDAPRLDLVGALVSVVVLASLVFGLIESATRGWDNPLIVTSFAVVAAGVVLFIVLEARLTRRGRAPLMPLALWRSRRLVAANLSGLAYFFAFFGILYFLSLELQQQRGFSALQVGASFLPMMLAMAVLGPVAGRLTARFTALPVLVTGHALTALGCLLLALAMLRPHDATSLADLEWRLLVVGLGSGLMSSPMSNLAVSSVEPAYSSTASAIHNMCRQIGSTLGVAALGVVVTVAPAFSSGVGRAMAVTAAVIAVTGLAAFLLGRGGGHAGVPGTRGM